MKNTFITYLKRLTLCAVLFTCVLSPCLAQTTSPLNLGKDSLQADSTIPQQVLHYQILSAQDELKLHWTGKGFAQTKGDKNDRQYVKAILRTFDASWLAHPLAIAMKTIRVQKNGDKQETMVVVAVKSAGKRWKINVPYMACLTTLTAAFTSSALSPHGKWRATNYDLKFTVKPYIMMW